MNLKHAKHKSETTESLRYVETFTCSVCGKPHPLAHLQQDHIKGLKLYGLPVKGPICFECWVLAWCELYEAFEKKQHLGYRSPERFHDNAPCGARVIGFKDVIQTME